MLGRALGTTTDSGRCVGLPAGGKERGQGEGRGEGGGGWWNEERTNTRGGGCILRESPVFLKNFFLALLGPVVRSRRVDYWITINFIQRINHCPMDKIGTFLI